MDSKYDPLMPGGAGLVRDTQPFSGVFLLLHALSTMHDLNDNESTIRDFFTTS
jgi:hypothetical protein